MLHTKKLRFFNKNFNKWAIKNQFNIHPYKFAIISLGTTYCTKNQASSCEKLVNRFLKRRKPRIKAVSNFNFYIGLTKKSLGARMGRGKGPIKCYVTKLVKYSIMFKFNNLMRQVSVSVLRRLLQYKLKIKLGYISVFNYSGFMRKDFI